jgi:choline kinase
MKIVLPAAGKSTRMFSHTHGLYSKAQLTLGHLPIIGHIITKFKKTDEIVIILGYKGELLKQVVDALFGDYNITYVYDNDIIGLGHTLLLAKHLLQEPFIIYNCDTVIPSFNAANYDMSKNWMIGSKQYDKLWQNYTKILPRARGIKVLPKTENTDDCLNYVGVSYVKDYDRFWQVSEDNLDEFIQKADSFTFNHLKNSTYYEVNDWIDTGNDAIYQSAFNDFNSKMSEIVLPKPEEAIWFYENKVVKFHIDPAFISGRVNRYSNFLSSRQKENGINLPKLISYSKNTYTYKRADGITLSNIAYPKDISDLLSRHLNIVEESLSLEDKIKIYNSFYYDKTIKRIEKLCKQHEIEDCDCTINNVRCKSATNLINSLDWEMLAKDGIFTKNVHGDFHLDNILLSPDNKYIYLDWRQTFNNKDEVGDLYYDIAKLWHALIIPQSVAKANKFSISISYNENDYAEIVIDFDQSFRFKENEQALKDYLCNTDINVSKAELMTSLIYLNIAACHTDKYALFIFHLGKYLLNRWFNNNQGSIYVKH